MTEKTKTPIWKKWWVWLIVVVVLGAIGQSNQTDNPDTAAKSSAAAVPQIPLPEDQTKFLAIVTDAQAKVGSAANDMQKGGIKAERDKALCGAGGKRTVKDWIGKLVSIDANSDGKGVLEIELADDIKLKTWNNALSDIGDLTLIEPGTPLFTTASSLAAGTMVTFSGTFLRGTEGECLRESSMTLDGKIADPEFIFRFSAIAAAP